VQGDGYDTLKVAGRLGILHLPRQVCYQVKQDGHTMPGNAVLPPHEGMLITRGLQEWACLLPQDLPFDTAQRLLGWQTQEPAVLSTSELRQLVQEHGQVIRAAEAAEVKARVERAYNCPVAAVLPHSEEMMTLASGGIFALRYPDHTFTQSIREVATHILA
jgi:hypothetical protein